VKDSKKEKFLKTFGTHVAKIRRQKKISQEQLSFDTGIDLSTISRIERGILNISIYNAYRIAKGLGVPYSQLHDFEF
jgi:transcriptional regulator with XRE-family HTH domain